MSQVKFTTSPAPSPATRRREGPKTVENFLAYVAAGHYDNTIFHRVIKGFMTIQGGGFSRA